MPSFRLTFEDVVLSRTPSKRTKVIEADDIVAARKVADNDAEVAWGYQRVVDVRKVLNAGRLK